MDGKFGSTEKVLWPVSIFAGIVMCKIVYEITGLISREFFKGYNSLSKPTKIEWNNRGFSTFHAILVAAISFYLLVLSDLFDETAIGSIVHRKSLLSDSLLGMVVVQLKCLARWKHYCMQEPILKSYFVGVLCHLSSSSPSWGAKMISIGYFLTDFGMILWYFPALGGMEYVLHHVLSMYAIILSLISGQAQYYILMILFSEITTPFVNLRWYLDVYGKKSSMLYICNGVALFLGWLAVRILLFIFFFAHTYLHFEQVKTIFPLGFYSILSVPPLIAVMNAYWFLKIFKGLVKTLSRKRRAQ